MKHSDTKFEIHPLLEDLRTNPNANNGMGDYFKTKSGDKLYYRSWRSSEQKGIIIGIHGMAAHSAYYILVADYLINENLSVIGLDLKHHGKSSGRKGDLKKFEDCVDQLHEFILSIKNNNPNTPIFLMGQSMGSIISINYSIKYPKIIQGLILTSPGVKSNFNLSLGDVLKLPLLLLVYLFHKGARVINVGDRSERGTRVPLRKQYQEEDTLRIQKISPRYLIGLLKWKKKSFKNAKNLSHPVHILLGTEDKILSVEGVKEFFNLIPVKEKKLTVIEGGYHSLFSDPAMIQQGGWKKLKAWLFNLI